MQIIPLLGHPSLLDARGAEIPLRRFVQTKNGAEMRLTGSMFIRSACESTTYDSIYFLRSRNSHIFDGVNITKETAAFQLCDIHDRMLMNMIKDEDDLREICNVSLPHLLQRL